MIEYTVIAPTNEDVIRAALNLPPQQNSLKQLSKNVFAYTPPGTNKEQVRHQVRKMKDHMCWCFSRDDFRENVAKRAARRDGCALDFSFPHSLSELVRRWGIRWENLHYVLYTPLVDYYNTHYHTEEKRYRWNELECLLSSTNPDNSTRLSIAIRALRREWLGLPYKLITFVLEVTTEKPEQDRYWIAKYTDIERWIEAHRAYMVGNENKPISVECEDVYYIVEH